MTISLHKLTAGSGYDYLTRQVAVQDATEKGHTSLASYYTEKGETPGLWIGAGMTGIDGLSAGDVVTAEQMLALFGSGHHPLAEVRRAELSDGASDAQVRAVTRLGTPFKVYSGDVSEFRIEVARRLEEVNVAAGRASSASIPTDERARVRSKVAREFFVREHGREPMDARELAATVAKHSRPRTTTIAGFDLTFSPVKSVSTLWAVADTTIAAKVEHAHQAAAKDALTFIESHALFTRTGTNGVRQVDVTGLVAAAFTHRDSRAGDPDLHTHVAVANKVQTTDGRWLAIDGRILYKAKVAASETYNTALERHLTASLGVVFAERPNSDRRKRGVREIVGVDPALNTRWSSRRASIEFRRDELASQFLRDHGRPPSPVEMIVLAQQATLETRDPKHEPRSLTEQRTTWRHQAVEILGSERALEQMIAEALAPTVSAAPNPDHQWIAAAAERVLQVMEEHRSTWQSWHVRAEALRQVRGVNVAAADVATVVDLIVDDVLHTRSVPLTTDADSINEPEILRRADGSSVYHVAGSEVYTSGRVLAAEQRIVAAAGQIGGRVVDDMVVELALLESAANGTELNAGQAHLVRQLATSRVRVQLAIAPAGSGKTTSMRVLAAAWQESGGTVIGLAPSAAAAAVLGEQTGTPTDTLAKLIHDLNTGRAADWIETIGPDTLVVIDEAGMADTLSLDTAVAFVLGRGASVRLVGDDQQLAAIGAGGVLRDIAATHGALRLSELMRFADSAEGAASLALREGLPEGLGFYLDCGRVHVGDQTTLVDEVFTAWESDRGAGLDSIMLAPTRELAAGLNARARAARLAVVPAAQQPVVRLADGNLASAGDMVITRTNDRRLRVSGTDWVKNGDRWHITNVDRHGDLKVCHVRTGVRVTLPANYVRASTELGYASTVHTAQGVSVDTMHGLATGTESRQQLYTMLTRGRQANHVYVVVTGDGDPHSLIRPETIRPQTATDILETILARDGSARSATTIARDAADPAVLLGQAAARYVDALYAGAESVIGADRTGVIEQTAEQLVPGIVDEPAWPVLRAHLVLIEARGRDAAHDLESVVVERELDGVRDRAAILDWRLDPTGLRGSRPGPLPWLPAIPAQLADHPDWGPYLGARASRVDNFNQQVRQQASTSSVPAWARRDASTPAADVLAEVAVWRAATNVPTDDRRPTGAPQLQKAAALWQRHLDEQITGGRNPAMAEWGPLIGRHAPARDPFTTLLAERLAAISRSGLDASGLLRTAAAEGPLPDDHAAAALWWRISAHLSPAVATQVDSDRSRLVAGWADALVDTFSQDRAAAITQSPSWPALITQVDHAISRGWTVADLLDVAQGAEADDVDPAQSILWRIAIVTDPPPLPEDRAPSRFEPDPAAPDVGDLEQLFPLEEHLSEVDEQAASETTPRTMAPKTLTAAIADRELLGPLEPTDADIDRRARLEVATQTSPTQRWAVLAGELDPRLLSQRDWPVTAQMIQDVHDAGHDVRALAHELVGRDPLTNRPAQDLRYRLVGYIPEESLAEITVPPPAEDKRRLSAAAREHERTRPMQRPIDGPRR